MPQRMRSYQREPSRPVRKDVPHPAGASALVLYLGVGQWRYVYTVTYFVDVFDGFFRVSFIVQTLGIEQQDVRIADEGMLKPE